MYDTDDHGIAWMIAGGSRAVSREEQLQRLHRMALANGGPTEHRAWSTEAVAALRERLSALKAGPNAREGATTTLAGDCCPA